MHLLPFSTPYLAVHHNDPGETMHIDQPTILFNPSETPWITDDVHIPPRSSIIVENATINPATESILITSELGFSDDAPYPERETLIARWTQVYDIFPLPHLKETQLWRSPKERIGSVSFNLWFAAAGTDCGIHNEHDFLEVHTQVWGTGHMQKFHEKDAATLYQDIVMTPGFTHAPFCDAALRYPWHRYLADTDCIWLAVEYHT